MKKFLQLEGRLRFPLMLDPNTGRAMYESDDIIRCVPFTRAPYPV